MKCVVDGCSDGIHSEVGAKLFCHLYSNGMNIDDIFTEIISTFKFNYIDVKNYLCFTILSVTEDESSFIVEYCGDGYIIKQKHDDDIEFEKLDDGEYPKYFAYNHIESSHLTHYQDGVSINRLLLSKSDYKRIGVASDGLRYMFDQDFQDEFISYLQSGKESALKRLINREAKYFKDDITITF